MRSKVHPKYKTKYRVGNWSAYEQALVQRGDVTLWLSADATDAWRPSPSGRPGAPDKFSPMPADYFSPDYLTARSLFRQAVKRADGQLISLELAATDPGGDHLTIDVAWFGAEHPSNAVVHSSGIHGVEGFAGSAIQLQWLDEGMPEVSDDSAIVLLHVLNPYGMAWLRRVNENNVDLNRNFLSPGEPYTGAPEGYEALDALLNPTSPPAREFFSLRVGWAIVRRGIPAFRQAVAGGQYVNPRGLFFGGSHLEAGPRLIQQFVQSRLAAVERLVVVDVHTGLGRFGRDTVLVSAADEGTALFASLRETFGDPVRSTDPRRGPAYRVRGAYDDLYPRALPQATVHFVAQEFGTYRAVRVLSALRAENRWHHYGAGSINHRTKRDLAEVFAPADESWRSAVLRRGRVVIGQALALGTAPTTDTKRTPRG